MRRRFACVALWLAAVVGIGAGPATVAVPDAVRAIVAAPDRSEADRALDAGRHPAEMLAVFAVAPGMKVAELGAGGGYTAELLARAVGPTGVVFAQNSKFILERFAAKPWAERLAKPVMKRVVRVDREFDDPLPPEARGRGRLPAQPPRCARLERFPDRGRRTAGHQRPLRAEVREAGELIISTISGARSMPLSVRR